MTVENGPGTLTLGAGDRAAAVAAVKARLRVVSADEDALIAAFAESALGLAERVTGLALIVRSMTQVLSGSGGWQRLGVGPVRAIGVVSDDGRTALAADSYAVDIDGDGIGWIRVAAGLRVTVAFTAGLSDGWDALPAPIREGAGLLAAHLFDDRTGQTPVPAAVAALWRPYRMLRLGGATVRAGAAA